ncbi:MAG: ImmA/IrrE family metallo-endopeptidase [Bacteroidetes bacterium]|nr:ImmA/IrrE family metallo-endopeptidase [Bacteroidota bacterium]
MRAVDEANKIIKKLGVTSPPVRIEKYVRKLGVSLVPHNFDSNISGVLFIKKNKPIIGYSPLESEVRRRFTIAHEFGHFLLHKGNLYFDKRQILFRNEESATGETKREREANAFAAALLMPENFIRDELTKLDQGDDALTDEQTIKSLAKKFQVSEIAMTYRLINLNYIRQ